MKTQNILNKLHKICSTRAILVFRSKKPAYTHCMNGQKISKDYLVYFCLFFHGFRAFKPMINPLYCNTECVFHILGFRFTKNYLTQSELRRY